MKWIAAYLIVGVVVVGFVAGACDEAARIIGKSRATAPIAVLLWPALAGITAGEMVRGDFCSAPETD